MKDKKTILIAEDDRAIAKALELKLKKNGYNVLVVGNGQDALEILVNKTCDLLVLDLMMPVKDGFAVLEELHKSQIKVPVVVASNLGQTKDIERATALGVKDYYIKSEISIQGIVDKIDEVLKGG